MAATDCSFIMTRVNGKHRKLNFPALMAFLYFINPSTKLTETNSVSRND